MRAATVTVVVAALALGIGVDGSAATITDDASTTADPPAWRAILDRAVEASRSRAFTGSMVIVGLSDRGPNLAEVDVAQDDQGALTVGRTEAWMVGHGDGEAFFWQPGSDAPLGAADEARRAGTLLRLGSVDRAEFSVERLLEKYRVELGERRALETGSASVLEIRQRDTGRLRERLFVDTVSDLVVRRDTYRADGTPIRSVAYSSLHVAAPTKDAMQAPDDVDTSDRAPLTSLDGDELDRLGADGWSVHARLPGSYELTHGWMRPTCQPCDAGEEQTAVHLLYSDGLYNLSLYQQPGQLADVGLEGSVATREGDTHVHRWPGSEPERMVFGGDGYTFTVVSDAPPDELMRVLAALPGEMPPSLLERIGRGLGRAVGWLQSLAGDAIHAVAAARPTLP